MFQHFLLSALYGFNTQLNKEENQMPENKEIETMLAQTSREETKEILNFIQTLTPYEKREFIGIMQGAKMVKMWQAEQEEAYEQVVG